MVHDVGVRLVAGVDAVDRQYHQAAGGHSHTALQSCAVTDLLWHVNHLCSFFLPSERESYDEPKIANSIFLVTSEPQEIIEKRILHCYLRAVDCDSFGKGQITHYFVHFRIR